MPRRSKQSASARRSKGRGVTKADLKRLRNHPFKYRPQFGVIIVCKDEQDHRRIFDGIKSLGIGDRVRAVAV